MATVSSVGGRGYETAWFQNLEHIERNILDKKPEFGEQLDMRVNSESIDLQALNTDNNPKTTVEAVARRVGSSSIIRDQVERGKQTP